jgi:hypothetical protein
LGGVELIVNIGDEIESEYGRGKIVAITKHWIVHEDGTSEVAVPIGDCEFWVPAEPGIHGTMEQNLEF